MLIGMRTMGGKWVLMGFSFIIIVSFGFWGIGDVVRGIFSRTSNTVAFVGDVKLSNTQLSREFRRQLNLLQARFGGNLDSAKARDLGLVERVVDTLIERTLYDLEAQRLGLVIGDDLIRDAIRRNPGFRNSQGVFDPNIYASVLAASGLTESEFVARVRHDLKRAHLVGSLAAAAAPPDVLVKSLYRHRQQRRVADFFVVTNGSVGEAPTPDHATLAAFHEENAPRFTAPEYRALTFIHITPEDLVGEVAVSEEEILAEYDDRRASFTQTERRTVDQILLPDEATARAAHDDLTRGRDFTAVAAKFANMNADDVSLGTITRNDLFGDVADTVFDLGAGEISAPVQSPFGWHVFRVAAIGENAFPPLAELRAEIEREIALRGAADALYRLTTTLDDTLAAGATLEGAAGQLKLRLTRVAAIDSGGTTPESARADLPGGAEFLTTAFATPAGVTSLLNESDDGSSFIVRVDSVTPPALKPLDRIRDEVEAAWRESELDKAAAARAAAAAERINDGEDFAKVAADLGHTARASAPVRRDRDGAERSFSPRLVAALFALDVGKAHAAPAGDGTGHVVARLADIVEADPNADEAGLTALRDELRVDIAGDFTAQYRDTLRKRYPVDVNRRAIDALF
ncbi:MAG: SurA N-terminal domain-containing protein [Proteobacteria bacterium]|nr:SurA N-terminal domain-containing protein [Pseudomonadota bacterium]